MRPLGGRSCGLDSVRPLMAPGRSSTGTAGGHSRVSTGRSAKMVPLSLGRIDVFSFRRSLNHFRSAVSAGECLHNGWVIFAHNGARSTCLFLRRRRVGDQPLPHQPSRGLARQPWEVRSSTPLGSTGKSALFPSEEQGIRARTAPFDRTGHPALLGGARGPDTT